MSRDKNGTWGCYEFKWKVNKDYTEMFISDMIKDKRNEGQPSYEKNDLNNAIFKNLDNSGCLNAGLFTFKGGVKKLIKAIRMDSSTVSQEHRKKICDTILECTHSANKYDTEGDYNYKRNSFEEKLLPILKGANKALFAARNKMQLEIPPLYPYHPPLSIYHAPSPYGTLYPQTSMYASSVEMQKQVSNSGFKTKAAPYIDRPFSGPLEPLFEGEVETLKRPSDLDEELDRPNKRQKKEENENSDKRWADLVTGSKRKGSESASKIDGQKMTRSRREY
jgi:hypothetical protein